MVDPPVSNLSLGDSAFISFNDARSVAVPAPGYSLDGFAVGELDSAV
jgi:hypothetical protein